MKLPEIAQRINEHLNWFENNPALNISSNKGMRPFYNASARYIGGNSIRVSYVSFQGTSVLTKADALLYLKKLDAGFVGRHYEALRNAT